MKRLIRKLFLNQQGFADPKAPIITAAICIIAFTFLPHFFGSFIGYSFALLVTVATFFICNKLAL
ncbi:hypothetical protein P9597_11135 [Aneurinibacillus migulanus]|uniref:hypothetical protein n=1 Tax=Aneurinibacillus migulanus TaxID=47500 RepID=UPI002E1D95B3|nr:hypothetical protein [Aneurinibacillus migulanus]